MHYHYGDTNMHEPTIGLVPEHLPQEGEGHLAKVADLVIVRCRLQFFMR